MKDAGNLTMSAKELYRLEIIGASATSPEGTIPQPTSLSLRAPPGPPFPLDSRDPGCDRYLADDTSQSIPQHIVLWKMPAKQADSLTTS